MHVVSYLKHIGITALSAPNRQGLIFTFQRGEAEAPALGDAGASLLTLRTFEKSEIKSLCISDRSCAARRTRPAPLKRRLKCLRSYINPQPPRFTDENADGAYADSM